MKQKCIAWIAIGIIAILAYNFYQTETEDRSFEIGRSAQPEQDLLLSQVESFVAQQPAAEAITRGAEEATPLEAYGPIVFVIIAGVLVILYLRNRK